MRFETLTLKSSPNQYLVAPEGLCQKAQPHLISPVYEMSADALEDLLAAKLLELPRTKEAVRSAEDGQRAFVQRSAFIGFPDTLIFQTYEVDGEHSSLAIYSRSHIGWSDMGVNKRRVSDLLASLK